MAARAVTISRGRLRRSVESISAERLARSVDELARRTKHAGTPGELESLRWVEAELASYGYRTELLLHDAYISLPGPARLEALGRELRCIGHSFSREASGLELRLVAGDGPAAGCALLLDGIATPASTLAARARGALAQVHVSPDEHLHEMCISPVWGSPDDERLDRLPQTVVVTVDHATGDELRTACAAGPVEVRLSAEVDTGWRQTPILIAELGSVGGAADEPFVLFSGHHDTWHRGAMDNGGANATMLEVARVCSLHRDVWHRGLRLAFWSGHSQGRYSGSAWYADTHWEELEARALVHVNVDSTGGRGNTVVSDTSAAAELHGLAREALREQADEEFAGRRSERAGDQSFWGIGVPSIFANMSEQPAAGGAANAMGAVLGGGARRGAGTGWWWHTPDDTRDKLDLRILLRDTRIYQHAVWRLLAEPVPPLDYAAAAHELVETLEQRQAQAGTALDLSVCLERARELERTAAALDRSDPERATEQLRRLSRVLVPLAYTRGDRFTHDPALGQPALPALADAARLPGLEGDERRFLASRLVREANRVAAGLRAALEVLG